jgi:methylglutaconyl-CoA hydratase
VVADARLGPEADALLGTLAGRSPSALALSKRLFYQLDGLSFADGIALGARINALARSTPDFREAVGRFLEKR